ncbi:MAG: M14 family zinc carboxypeptidase [Candidatus Saccharicenans sp.]|uniref:M14 family zinc carboxypeptidase n=1 Tax=Candidatus Saccharicenans sp. TaxID=2819258 RepID=UPI00404B6C7E
MKFRIKTIFFISLILLGFTLLSAAVQIKTPAEETRFKQYTQYEELVRFLSLLEARSPVIKVKIVGRTKEVENYPARDLFLCLLTEEGAREPEDLNRKKPTILFIASQHGNEQSAKEAALRLVRDLAAGDLKPLLRRVNVLVMPQANPYGNFYDVRQNEIGLDLNRDHVKLEGESTRAIHRVFALYQPEITMDIHEKGDDYYRVSVGCVSNLNIHQSLQDYSRGTILKEIEKKLEKKKITFHEYLVSEVLGLDTSSGARIAGQESGRERMLRYSTTDLNDGRNSLGIYETLAFIQEGSSRHNLETLEARTNWQYEGLRALVEVVAERPEQMLTMVRELRAKLLRRAEARAADDPVHLRMTYVRDPEQPELVLKVFERSVSPIRGILRVDKKAGDYLTAQDITPYQGPSDLKVVTRVEKNWFPRVESRLTTTRPAGYFIPADRLDLVEVLVEHGIKVQMLEKAVQLEAIAYKITSLVPASADYLAPEKIEVQPEKLKLAAKRGDFFVSCHQPAANLIPCLLEPQSEYGLIRYFKFRLVPEEGDYFAIYRLEEIPSWPLVDFKGWK